MTDAPTMPELPEYLVQDMAALDLLLRQACRNHLERGDALPADVVTLLCERFIHYSDALAEYAERPKGNPGKSTGRVVALLRGTGWELQAAVAHVAKLSGQEPGTVEKSYYRWRKRSEIGPARRRPRK